MPRGNEHQSAVPPFSLHAWVDESVTVADTRGPGGYVLAAVIADPLTCDPVRDKLMDLVLRGRDRLHWRDERPARRDLIAQTVADGDFAAVVTVGTPMRRTTQERTRSCCLDYLLLELQKLGVNQVWLESRSESSNRKDLRAIEAMHGSEALARQLRVNFHRPKEEPMLWLPDAVAGAVTASRRGQTHWLQILGRMVTLVEVRVP